MNSPDNNVSEFHTNSSGIQGIINNLTIQKQVFRMNHDKEEEVKYDKVQRQQFVKIEKFVNFC